MLTWWMFFQGIFQRGVKEPKEGRGRKEKYPFSEMSVGDMFEQPIEDYYKVARAAHQYAKRKNVKMRIRKIDNKTCGVWRVKI